MRTLTRVVLGVGRLVGTEGQWWLIFWTTTTTLQSPSGGLSACPRPHSREKLSSWQALS